MAAVRTRIAPTPSGYLHKGNAFSFLLTQHIANRHNGTLLLRIDDMDAARIRAAYIQDIFDSLHWLNITPNEGPENIAEFTQKYSQHLRLSMYLQYVNQLVQAGHVYACTCSRSQIQALHPQGVYQGTCRYKQIPLDTTGSTLRVKLYAPQSTISFFDFFTNKQVTIDLQATMGDFVIQRKDGLPAYQLTSLADDVLYKINTIVRGEDLLYSTAAQLYIAHLINANDFINTHFYHHPLLVNEAQTKLSKSAGDNSLQFLRNQGMELHDFLKILTAINL